MHRCTISHIDPDSPLRHAAHPGDRLVSINGNPITDVLDYKYYAYDPELAVCLRRPDGTEHTVHVSKPLGGELGLDFETYLMDNAHSCANHCVFCFIDQMPPGMRPTLYFKDDDARLSFLMGNYMTLTNLSEREVQRIIHLHISPINVSVHATDPELRSFLLGNPRAGKTLEIMRRFSDGGITMNCQIVCCPGLNDGAQLQRTMHDLAALYPKVHSVSIVPVGLTKFREGLYPLTPFTPEHAAETLDLVNIVAAAVIARAGIALGVFVRQVAAHGLHHGRAREILGRDQLQVVALAPQLPLHGGVQFWVGQLQVFIIHIGNLRLCQNRATSLPQLRRI